MVHQGPFADDPGVFAAWAMEGEGCGSAVVLDILPVFSPLQGMKRNLW